MANAAGGLPLYRTNMIARANVHATAGRPDEPWAHPEREAAGRSCYTHATTRGGFTLVELLIALSIVSILSAVAVPKVATMLDDISVRGAVNDVDALLETARHTAMTRSERATVELDTARVTASLRVGHDTLIHREQGTLFGVRFKASRTSVTYTQLGLGFGVSNLTLVVSKGEAAETLTVSRLGRVRR